MNAKCCAALLSLFALGAVAADGNVYRWVDGNGVTHLSDQAPRPRLKPNSEHFNAFPSPTRRESDTTLAVDGRSSAAPEAVSPPRKPHARLPADFSVLEYPPLGDSAYDRKLRRYYESQACFARFRNANGSVKAEAYAHCTEVPFPTRE